MSVVNTSNYFTSTYPNQYPTPNQIQAVLGPGSDSILYNYSSNLTNNQLPNLNPNMSASAFFSGMLAGVNETLKTLFTPIGILSSAAGISLCIAFPVTAPLILDSLAGTAGIVQIYSGLKSNDLRQVGMGVDGVLLAGLGMKSAKSFHEKHFTNLSVKQRLNHFVRSVKTARTQKEKLKPFVRPTIMQKFTLYILASIRGPQNSQNEDSYNPSSDMPY